MAAERELSSSNRLALTPTHQIYLNRKKLIIHGGKVMAPCLREREGDSICIPRANAAHYKNGACIRRGTRRTPEVAVRRGEKAE